MHSFQELCSHVQRCGAGKQMWVSWPCRPAYSNPESRSPNSPKFQFPLCSVELTAPQVSADPKPVIRGVSAAIPGQINLFLRGMNVSPALLKIHIKHGSITQSLLKSNESVTPPQGIPKELLGTEGRQHSPWALPGWGGLFNRWERFSN